MERAALAPKEGREAPAASTPPDLHHDRARLPADTVELVRRHFSALGITRLARQTGLDRIGIPVWCAVRPNAQTLAVNQGKGVDDDAARASAVMEAVEYAVAEQPSVPVTRAPPAALAARGAATLPLARFLPPRAVLPPDEPIDWVAGESLLTGASVLVPLDLFTLGDHFENALGFVRSTNGLASGNTVDEATLHGLCELVERDAATLFAHRPEDAVLAARVDALALGDPVLRALAEQVRAAGCELRLFDMTTDLAIPCFFAAIVDGEPAPRRHFDLSTGSGCHPVAARAAIRAVTEAAQTRVTTIAGARDDFDPRLYDAPLRRDLRLFLRDGPVRRAPRSGVLPPGSLPPGALAPGASIGEALAFTRDRLRAGGVRDAVRVVLGGDAFGVAVARVLSPDLEDAPVNPHWRPGRRALRSMMGLV